MRATSVIGAVLWMIAAGCTARDDEQERDGGVVIAPSDAGTPRDASRGDAMAEDDAGPADAGFIPGYRLATAEDLLAITCEVEAEASCTSSACACPNTSDPSACMQTAMSACAAARGPVVSGIHVSIEGLERCREARIEATSRSCASGPVPDECIDVFTSLAAIGRSCGRFVGAPGVPVSCAEGAGRCTATFGAGYACLALVAPGESCAGPDGSALPCAEGSTCVGGRCATSSGACVRNAECAVGEACVDGQCGRQEGAVGEECGSRADCAAGLACIEGLCAVRACNADDRCPTGAQCIPVLGETLCRPRLAEGESCFEGADPPCASGLVCVRECVAPLADGAECSRGNQCRSGLCLDEVCVPPASRGERCGSSSECEAPLRCVRARCTDGLEAGVACRSTDDCAAELLCDIGDDGTNGVCAPIPQLGDACIDGRCGEGLVCDATLHCAEEAPRACTSTSQCRSGQGCISGRCQSCDEACTPDEYCVPSTRCISSLCGP